MGKPYSQDLRERVLGALERGEKLKTIAERLEVSHFWVRSVRQRFKETGSRQSLPQGGKRVSRLAPLQETIRSWIAERPDLTLEAICARLLQEHAIQIDPSSVWDQLNNWGLTYKKNSPRRRTRTP